MPKTWLVSSGTSWGNRRNDVPCAPVLPGGTAGVGWEEGKLDDVHEGTIGGRACWVVSGFCKGEVQGTLAQKFKNCERCDFYQLVRQDEGMSFVLLATLLAKLLK